MRIVDPTQNDPPTRRGRRRLRTIAVLPTLLTLGNLLCGFAAVYFCMLAFFTADVDPGLKITLNNPVVEHFLPTFISVGGFLIFLGMFFDMMDGRVARMTRSTTNFGGQLDSLADMVTFGVAPAMLMISLVTIGATRNAGLTGGGFEASGVATGMMMLSSRWAWTAGAIFAACAALRLARFNVEHAQGGSKYNSFRGLPAPGAGAVLASLVVMYEHVAEVRGELLAAALPYIALLAGLLMVSRIRYVHVANTYLRSRRPFGYVVIMLIILGLLIRWPAQTIAGLVCAYAASGPVGAAWRIGWIGLAGGRGRANRMPESGKPADSVEKSA